MPGQLFAAAEQRHRIRPEVFRPCWTRSLTATTAVGEPPDGSTSKGSPWGERRVVVSWKHLHSEPVLATFTLQVQEEFTANRGLPDASPSDFDRIRD